MRCCTVSLLSFKKHNAEDDMAIATNVDIAEPYKSIFENNGIKIIRKDFTEFVFPKDFMWSLAFYKLCALKYVVEELDYDKYLMVDSDTYCISDLYDMWNEADGRVMLYNLQHSFSNYQSVNMREEYSKLYGTEGVMPVNYGGEFIAGDKAALISLIADCEAVYRRMIEKNVPTKHGDEFIVCSAVEQYGHNVRAANAYIYRYWTRRFYLVSTNFEFNRISIMHLPSEKETGFAYAYKYYRRHKELPPEKKLRKMMGLPGIKTPMNLYYLRKLILSARRKLKGKKK